MMGTSASRAGHKTPKSDAWRDARASVTRLTNRTGSSVGPAVRKFASAVGTSGRIPKAHRESAGGEACVQP